MSALLRAELLKVRTTRSAWVLLGAMVLLTVGAVIGAVVVAGNLDLDLSTEEAVRRVLHVSGSGAVFVLVLGVMMSAGEHRHGTATETFLTTPNRWRVLVAKVIVATGVGAAFGLVAAGAALGAATHAYGMRGEALDLGAAGGWSILGGAVLYAAIFGALGAATGSLVRNQVTAIVAWMVWIFAAEQVVLGIVPGLGRWLPAAAGRALVRDPASDLLGQPSAAVVLVVYASAIMAVGAFVERRRDA